MQITQKQAARSLRILYPLWTVVGIFGLVYVPSVISGADATETGKNILAHTFLFKSGITAALITQLIFVFSAIMWYHLFKTVSRTCTLNLMVLALVSVPIAMVSTLGQTAAYLVLSGSEYLSTFGLHGAETFSALFLSLNEAGIVIASIFWGLWLFPLANLIRQSGYFPKAVQILVMIAGVGYVLDSFTKLLFSAPDWLLNIFELLTLGELALVLWLTFRGPQLPAEAK